MKQRRKFQIEILPIPKNEFIKLSYSEILKLVILNKKKGKIMYLSKSLYTRGLQCVKSLWLKKHNKEVLAKPNEATERIFATGDKVGALACQLFPNGKKVPFENTTFDEKINLTKKWLDEKVDNIYEATFEFEGILVMIDILHIIDHDSKQVEIYEVKSSTGVKDVYLHDASIQYYILKGLGYNVTSTNIIHLNNEYVRY